MDKDGEIQHGHRVVFNLGVYKRGLLLFETGPC